jgi:hypothetical protein
MQKWFLVGGVLAVIALPGLGQEKEKEVAVAEPEKAIKATTSRVWRPVSRHPDGGQFVHFVPRDKLRSANAKALFKPAESLHKRAASLPIDWAKSLLFPMYLNDQLGDCYYAAGCHADNTWSGNASVKSEFSLSAIRSRYFALSGGDNGLADGDMQGEMMNRYLADVPAAKIVDWLNINTTDTGAVQTAMQRYGVIMFTFAVPDSWINNSDTGAIWDTGRANPNNGHAVIFNGCDTRGYYKLQTWGSYVWITPRGVTQCDPGGWVAFSVRWFGKDGYAPNGLHITELAKQWHADGGKDIPASVIGSFPPPGPTPPVPPGPTPTPTPEPSPGMDTITLTIGGKTSQYELFPIGTRSKLYDLQKVIGGLTP